MFVDEQPGSYVVWDYRWNAECRRRGFTLVELLIVIGVIVVLIALLLPAIGLVRDRARGAQCQNNLAQLGIAFRRANSTMPQPLRAADWSTRLPSFLENESDLLQCPAQIEPGTSYGMNDRAHRMQGGDGTKILMVDYRTEQVEAVRTSIEQQNWETFHAPRHRGELNVLLYGGSVVKHAPETIDPRFCKPFLDYWRPLRDFSISLDDCMTTQPATDGSDTSSGGDDESTGGGTDEDPSAESQCVWFADYHYTGHGPYMDFGTYQDTGTFRNGLTVPNFFNDGYRAYGFWESGASCNGCNTATWEFNSLEPGEYSVMASSPGADGLQFQIWDGTTDITSQSGGASPLVISFPDAGWDRMVWSPTSQQEVGFMDLGRFTIDGDSLTVTFANVPDQTVRLDAVRIEKIGCDDPGAGGPTQGDWNGDADACSAPTAGCASFTKTLDDADGSVVFRPEAGWGVSTSGYNGGQHRYVVGTTQAAAATLADFEFDGLEPGEYEVYVTWAAGSGQNTKNLIQVHYCVADGWEGFEHQLGESQEMNQAISPAADLILDGRPFQRITTGPFIIPGSKLIVRSNGSQIYAGTGLTAVADAVHIVRICP